MHTQPNQRLDADATLSIAREVMTIEREALTALASRLDDAFVRACQAILDCEERVVVVGMGKSGHIGGKIAATLASTGTPAFFVHPGEASHGDLGMITPTDLVIALSNSGNTPEILTIVPMVKRMGVTLVALTGEPQSTLGRQADICLDTSVAREACPHNLAPTSSTLAQLAMGDALAVALLRSRGFTAQDFARSHPGGTLGRRLLLYARDIMHAGDDVPTARLRDTLRSALPTMTGCGLGMIGIVDDNQRLMGIFTDGDLRRTLNQEIDIYACTMDKIMTPDPVTITADTLAAEVVHLIHRRSINGLFVVDASGQVLGALNTLDLLRAGVV
jgi:arabinose-5-phosphate isomerase